MTLPGWPPRPGGRSEVVRPLRRSWGSAPPPGVEPACPARLGAGRREEEPPLAGESRPERGRGRIGPGRRRTAGRTDADPAAPGRPLMRPALGAGGDSRRRRRSRSP